MRLLRKSISSNASAVRVLGVDPSLTSTGWAFRDEDGLFTGCIKSGDLRGPHRLFYMRNQLEKILNLYNPGIVYYEDYSLGSARNQQHLGELGGVYKTMLWDRGITVVCVPPSTMKSVIALKGSAKKPEIKKALRTRFGITVAQEDEADATGLLLIGEMICGKLQVPPDLAQSKRMVGIEDKCTKTTGRLQSSSKIRSDIAR